MEKKLSFAYCIRNDSTKHRFDTSVIREHNSIFAKRKKVCVGKLGSAARPLAHLQLHVDPRIEPKLIVFPDEPGKAMSAYIAGVKSIQRDVPPKDAIPTYYERTMNIQAWFQLASPLVPISANELEKWVIVTTGDPITSKILRKKKWNYFIACKLEDHVTARQIVRTTYGKQVARNAAIRRKRKEEDFLSGMDSDFSDAAY